MSVDKKFISYVRVSTDRQGESGLGLEAQREAVASYIRTKKGTLTKEFQEVESGKNEDRPALEAALNLCRRRNATLIVGKLDRLARNTRFLLSVVEGTGRRGVVFCDLPHIPGEGPQGKYIITIMAGNAEMEGAMISQRTKAALAQSKKKLGGRRVSVERFKEIAVIGRKASAKARALKASTWAEDRRQDIEDIKAGSGSLSLRQIADTLNERGILTARGTDENPGKWSAVKVKRVLDAA